MNVGTKYRWLLFLLWSCIEWLYQVIALQQIATWQHWNMMNAMLFSWSLLTWHQEFTTCGGMRREWDTWRINFWETFLKCVIATNKVKLWHISFIDKGCEYKSWTKNIHMNANILVETRVAMVLAWLHSGNSLQRCGKVYDIVKSTMAIIMRKFYSTTKKHLKPLMIPKDKIK